MGHVFLLSLFKPPPITTYSRNFSLEATAEIHRVCVLYYAVVRTTTSASNNQGKKSLIFLMYTGKGIQERPFALFVALGMIECVDIYVFMRQIRGKHTKEGAAHCHMYLYRDLRFFHYIGNNSLVFRHSHTLAKKRNPLE